MLYCIRKCQLKPENVKTNSGSYKTINQHCENKIIKTDNSRLVGEIVTIRYGQAHVQGKVRENCDIL